MTKNVILGVGWLSRRDLERRREGGRRWQARVTGVLIIDRSVDPALAAETIDRIELRGALVATPAVRRALAGLVARR